MNLMMLGLALLLAAQEVPPPTGVNDTVLGTAEQFRTAGPARVCLRDTSIDLLPGENAYLDYLGFHHGAIRVVGPRGQFVVWDGEAWIEPHGAETVPDRQGRPLRRLYREGRPYYLIYGPAGDRPRVRVEGDALGRSNDAAILRRIQLSQADLSSCRRRFDYGSEILLVDHPNR